MILLQISGHSHCANIRRRNLAKAWRPADWPHTCLVSPQIHQQQMRLQVCKKTTPKIHKTNVPAKNPDRCKNDDKLPDYSSNEPAYVSANLTHSINLANYLIYTNYHNNADYKRSVY